MPPSIDFVPDAQPVQTDQIDFQPDDVGQDYRPPSAVSGPAPTVPQPSTPQSLGFFRPFSTDLPEPEGKLGPLQTAGEMAASVPRAIGVATGVAGKGIEAGIGRVFGTGDTLEDIRASAERGEPLPVEKAAAKVPGIGGALLRGGLGIAETVPKLAAMSLFPQGIIAQSVAAGGLFGLDQQGNFSLKGAAIGALLPGSGALAKAGVARAITKGIAAGSTTLANPTAQWLLEEMGQQAALNAVMLAADSPEIIAQYRNDPAMARNTVQDIVGQNLAWALFGGVRHFVGGRPTATEAFIRKNAEKYGDAADAILKRRIAKTGFKGIGRDEITEMLERQVKRTAEKPPEAEPAEEVQPPFIPVTPAAPIEGAPDARQIPSPESVLEHEVRPPVGQAPPLRQPGEAAPPSPPQGEGQAPTPPRPSEPVAKPKVSADELVPMVEIGGKPVAATPDDITHSDILKRAGIDPESIPHEDPRRRFINPATGQQYTRLEAEAATGLKGTADAGGLDSTDLPRAKASPPAAPTGEAPPAKEPWQMTRDAFADTAVDYSTLQSLKASGDMEGFSKAADQRAKLRDEHRAAVKQAILDERPVPPEVLADYPDLVKAPPVVEQGAPPAAPAAGKTEAVPPATPEGTVETVTAGTAVASEGPKPSVPSAEPQTKVSEDDAIRKLLMADPAEMGGAQKAREIARLAKERGVTVKQMQEIIEARLVALGHEISTSNYTPEQKFGSAVGAYNRQPVMSARTSTSVEGQAYSTPMPLSVALNHALDVDPRTPIYDPTGGNGMLLIGGDLSQSHGNELNKPRAENMRQLGVGTVTENDATAFVPQRKYPIVKANPPFGSIDNVNYGGYGIKRLEHLISLKALEAMADNGRAAIILGAKREAGEGGKGAQWVFENYLYGHYNVVGNFEVAGELYGKQGAKWPVRVIIIDGRKANPIGGVLAPEKVDRYDTWDQVWKESDRIRHEIESRRQTVVPGGQAGLPVRPDGTTAAAEKPGGIPIPPEGTPGPTAAGGQRGGEGGRQPEIQGQPLRGGTAQPPARPLSKPEDEPPTPAGAPGGHGGANAPVEGGVRSGEKPTTDATTAGEAGGGGAKPGAVSKPAAGVKISDLAGLSEADLDAVLDAAVDAVSSETPKPTASKPSRLKTQKTTGQILGGAAKHAAKGTSKAIQALQELFGKGELLGTLGAFDETTYAKAKPIFKEAFEEYKAAGKSLAEAAIHILRQLGIAAKPYLKRFLQEEQQKAKTPVPEPPAVKDTEFQTGYSPRSKADPFGTLTPKNIADGTQSALLDLERRVGPVDEYLANRLNMSVEELRSGIMAGEQVDGAALAIDKIEREGSLIIGDEPGIGKGRQGAAVIRYAKMQGKLVMFFTKDPNLFTNMYGDALDIHTQLKPLIFGDTDKASIVDADGNRIHVSPGPGRQASEMERILRDGWGQSGYDSIFVTYSQINKRNARQQFLERMAADNDTIIILDESHEAAGDAATSMQAAFMVGGRILRGSGPKATFVQVPGLLRAPGTRPGRGGVLYMSATYAKRSENMPAYFRTSLSKAADTFGQIVDAMKRGGVALQQAVSEALAKAGEYIRRERDFSGVQYNMKRVEPANQAQLVDHIDQVTDVLSQISDFSDTIRTQITGSTAQSQVQITMTDFASIVHNQVKQLLLAAKADAVVAEAIAAKAKGEKPVIAVENTMESFLDHYVEDNGIRSGEPIKVRWNELLRHALKRQLRVTTTNPDGSTTIHEANPDDYGLGNLYRSIQSAADGIESKFPVSPIDYILQKLRAAGVSMEELTARQSGIRYSNFETGEGTYVKFPTANKNTVVNRFNGGQVDGMLMNASGSTGLSAHASEKFKDQRPRHMFIAQPASDINVFVQTLGRIRRTGMVSLGTDIAVQVPSQYRGELKGYVGDWERYEGAKVIKTRYGARYTHLVLPVQAEIRPAAVAAKKMKSLNANTTSEAEGAIKIQAEDLMNKYGDFIVASYLDEHPELQSATGLLIDHTASGNIRVKDEIAKQFTGRIALRPDAEQEQIYKDIIPAYNELIDQLKATGDYDLEISVHNDWDGRRLSDDQLRPGTDESNLFTSSVRVQDWEIKDQRHVPTGREMQQEFQRRTGGSRALDSKWTETGQRIDSLIEQKRAKLNADMAAAENDTVRYVIQGQLDRLDAVAHQWSDSRDVVQSLLRDAGDVIQLRNTDTGETYDGVLADVKLPTSGLRASPSNFKFRFSVDAPGGVLYLTARDFMAEADGHWEKSQSYKSVDDLIGRRPDARYQRTFIVGNPIRGYNATGGIGKVTRFTSQDGTVITGLLMPRNWNMSKLAHDPRLELTSGAAAEYFLRNHSGASSWRQGVPIEAHGGIVRITKTQGADSWTISTPAARRSGGLVYLDAGLRRITGDFTKVGQRMTAEISTADLAKVVDKIFDITKSRFRPVGTAADLMPLVSDSNTRTGGRGRGRGLSAIEAEGEPGVAPLPEDQIWQRLGEHGITRGGAVDLVNNPQGPAGRLLFDPKTGKPISIQLNQAKIGSLEGLDWTLEHEAAHWYDIENQDMRGKLQGALSDSEFLAILDHVQKLGYGEDVIADEITARGIQRLADQWKNRNWFEKLVGNIQRFAAEKLGFKMTRKAAESAAVRALAQGLELVRRAAYDQPVQLNDVLPEAKAGPEAKVAEGPPTDLSDEEVEQKRRQFGGMPGVGAEYTPAKIAEIDANVHRTFNPEDGVNPANDQKAQALWEKFTNPTTRTQAAADLANSTMERGSASMLFVNLWRHAVNQLLQNKDTRLFYDMIQRSEEFETREFVDFGPVGGNATGLDLRLRQEMVGGSFGRMKKYVEQQFAAAGRSLGEGPEVIKNLVEEFKKISDRLDPDEWANIIWTGKDSQGRTLQDILDSFGPERKAAEEIVAQIPKEVIVPAQKKTIIGTVHEWLKQEVVDTREDHARFTDSLYNRLLDNFTLTEAQARDIAEKTWERRIRDLGKETERMLDAELRGLDNLAERTADAFIRRIDQAEWKKEPKPNIIRDIIREALKKWDYPDSGRIFRQSVVPHGTDTYANDWITTLSGVLEANGLTKAKADELAHAVWTRKQNDYATANSRAMVRASQSKSLRSLIESIRTSPYLDQQNPEWMRQTAERWFQSNGLAPIHATAAAKLFVDQWRKAYQNAQIRVAEQVLKNPKQNIGKLVQAIRSGLLDPGIQWPAELAKRSAFRPLTVDQLRKIAELEKRYSDEKLSPAMRASLTEEMMGIMRHTGSPDFMRFMGESFAASLLSGVRTLTLNFVQPWFSLGAAWATHGIASPRDFPTLTRALYEFAKSAWPQAKFAWQKDAYSYQSSANVFHHNQLKRVYEQAQRDWKEGRYAKAALEFAFGWQQYVIRGLQTADQVGVAMAQQWKMALYGSMAMREAGFSTKQISELVDVAVAKRKSEAETALAAGYTPTEAAVIADEAATRAMQDFFQNKVGLSKAVAIREAAVYDAFLNVGRRPLTIEGVKPIKETDEGFLTRYLGINRIMKFVSEVRGESGGASILTISAVGFMNVPLRTARFYAGFGPYGLLRWGVDRYRTGRGMDPLWKQSFANELQAKARLREAVAGTAAMLGILGWQFNNQTSDDDVGKRAFAMYVTGHGPTRKTLRDAWTKRGFEPYTFHVVIDGKVRSKLPITRTGQVLSFAMGAAAAIDDVSWRQKQEIADHGSAKPIAGRELLAAIGTYYEIIGAQGVFQAFGRISQLRQGDLGTARAVGILASSTASALLIPGKSLIQWMENMIYSPVDRSSIATSMMANFPVLNAIYNGRAVNRFGDVLGDRTWSAKIGQSGIPIVFRVQDTPENKALYQMLVDKGASPTELLRANLEEKYGPLTQDQWLRFAKVSGESLKAAVVSNLPQLQSLPPQAVRQFMAGASEAANAQAAVTLGLTRVAGGGVASAGAGGGGPVASTLSLPRPPRLALPGPPSVGQVGGGRVPTAGAGSRSSSVLLPETAPAVYAPQVATGGFRRAGGMARMPRRSRLSYASMRQPRLVSGRLRARSGRIRRVRLSRPRRRRISYKG